MLLPTHLLFFIIINGIRSQSIMLSLEGKMYYFNTLMLDPVFIVGNVNVYFSV